MTDRSRFDIVIVLLVAALTTPAALAGGSATEGDPICVVTPPVDHPCIPDPVFPPDCVDQLGAIGGPPLAPGEEGYLGIASPVVNPMLRLRAPNDLSGRMYAVNPADNTVRVWEQDFVADIKVCYRPSALAQSADGSEVYVSCHAAHAVGVIDTAANLMIDVIQDRDNLGRPRLQEPMGIAVAGDTLYVASSQSNQVAVIDRASRQVASYIDIPGQDPRALTLADGGAYLIVANLLAGNRTEAQKPVANLPQVCLDLLADPTALAVFDENSPTFMDTSHPDYAMVAECYMLEQTAGATDQITINPAKPDHDLVVVRTSDNQVVFTTDSLATDIGTLNYGVAYDNTTSKVYLATVHAQNGLNSAFGNRPLINRLAILDLDTSTGALSIDSIKDLDTPFLNECGLGAAEAATPYAVAVDADRVAIAATGSDRLVLLDKSGNIQSTVPVGFGPKGVLLGPNNAWVYNATGNSVSRISLAGGSVSETTDIGNSQAPQLVRIGQRLFNSGEFAINKTFACASCHPDGHLDGLVWRLNDDDRLRATMTVQEIPETFAYHWDGSKCNQVKILQDGITNLFQGDEPSLCEMKTMIDFMDHLARPNSPFRPVDDSFTSSAQLGSAVLNRATFKAGDDEILNCSDRLQDMTVEDKYLEAIGDPLNPFFAFGGGGGPVPNTVVSENCSVANCHVAPHAESDGFRNGDPDQGLIDGFQAVSTLANWDRGTTLHDGRMSRAKYIEALDVNRGFNGASLVNPGENFTGVAATHGFNDGFFRHPEYNFDNNAATDAFALTDAMTQWIAEEEELQASTVGLSVALSGGLGTAPPLLDELESAADQGKIVLLGVGTLAGAMTSVSWQPGAGTYLTDGGSSLTRAQLLSSLVSGDSMVLYGGLLPNQGSAPNPKLRAVMRDTSSPYLCREGYTEYQGAALIGETDVVLMLEGIDVPFGSTVLVNGQVTGAPLAGPGPDFAWTLPAAPGAETILSIQILGPTGMLSNSLPLPIVPPVTPATEPQINTALKGTGNILFALIWDDQFGLTGPGTRYDVFRGLISDLGTLDSGACLTDPPLSIFGVIDNDPAPTDDGFYYVVRAENQANQSTWGSAARDAAINGAVAACDPMFP